MPTALTLIEALADGDLSDREAVRWALFWTMIRLDAPYDALEEAWRHVSACYPLTRPALVALAKGAR